MSTPLRVVSLESRNAVELARLLVRHGCEPISAPSMREVPLSDQTELFAFGERLMRDGVDVFLLLTGVGTRYLVDALSTRYDRAALLAAIGGSRLVCRGPKPVAVLKSLGLRPTLVAPEPNTWQNLLELLDAELPVAGRQVVVQEYGRTNQLLLDGLRAREAKLETVSIYAWAMPLDTAPLRAGIEALCRDRADVVLFTSAQQLEHLFALASELGLDSQLMAALRERVLCASIGPVTSEALSARAIPIDLVPEHPKMGHLVSAVAKSGPQLLAAKRAAHGHA
ncbi:MAG TPA: uroporphyrinogen-III synthase [Polyangiales bacterium]